MLTIAPPRAIRCAAARAPAKAATRFSSSISRSCASVVLARGRTPCSSVPPALFTQMSRRPKLSSAACASCSVMFSRRSPGSSMARCPRARTRSATLATSAARRAVTTTSAPASASATAIAAPMPRPEPVTTAARPSSRNRSRIDVRGLLQPLIEQVVEMPDLAFLVHGERHARFASSTQTLLHRLEVELVLVEDAGE